MSDSPARPRFRSLGQSIVAAVLELLRIRGREDAKVLRRSFEEHERFLHRQYPKGGSDDEAARKARSRAAAMREKSVRSQARIASARGWVGVYGLWVIATAAGASLVLLAARLLGG
jgi:hypothetical protein